MGEHPFSDTSHPAHAGDAPTGDVGIRVTSYQPTSTESELVALRREVARLSERNAVLEAEQLELEHLQQVDRLKDQFLSILSHELRTPINAIMGFGSVLDDEVAGPLTDQQHQYVQKMLKGADVLLALVNDLLDMSRIQAGKFSLSPQPIDFAQVAAETLESLGPLAEQKAIRLERELPSDLPPLRADPQRIGQVLVNLVHNAIKFTESGGRVTIAAWRDGHQMRCEVRDTGVGISPDDLGKLFNPFTQLDMTATRRAGGTGLGLTIARALVEAHGGRIGVHSQPGIGSTFWFVLPLSGPPDLPRASAA